VAGRVRITGGTLRGRALDVAAGVRPSEGRVREALFSIWQGSVPNAAFLDLFAGSGAVGLEALSRGASSALFVDSSPRVLTLLKGNCRGLDGACVRFRRATLPRGLVAFGADCRSAFDLIFADPPYAFAEHARLLNLVVPLLALRGELAVEHSARVELPSAVGELAQVDVRRYGESALSFYRHTTDPPTDEPTDFG
jgi:16S rRNA (guanine966-N2)-methyltransferase